MRNIKQQDYNLSETLLVFAFLYFVTFVAFIPYFSFFAENPKNDYSSKPQQSIADENTNDKNIVIDSDEAEKHLEDGQDDMQDNVNDELDDKSEKEKDNMLVESPFAFTYPDAVRGIYVTGNTVGVSRFETLLELVNTTDLNAMVIDIKDDYGYITYRLRGTPYDDISRNYIKDPTEMLETLSKYDIYPIARVVVFKDTVLAEKRPEYSFLSNGSVWKNRGGEAFVNPFLREVWDYNVEIAKMAAELGFREIQFDYVRFAEGFETRDTRLEYSFGEYTEEKLMPRILREWEEKHREDFKLKENYEENLKQINTRIRETEGLIQKLSEDIKDNPDNMELKINIDALKARKFTMEEEAGELTAQIAKLAERLEPPRYSYGMARVTAVTDFVEYAANELKPYGVDVSVDVFGYAATLPEARGIGQNFLEISRHVDVISSMIYPSHWGPGYFGIARPDTEPYRLTKEYAKVENELLAQLEQPPTSRPWIQDFTATWLGSGNYIRYGKEEVEAQIRALNEEGINEFLLWNAGNRYTAGVNYRPLDN